MPFFSALNDNNTLIVFDSNNPNVVTTTAVTGVNGTLIGIDTRPANGLVYGISTTNQIYTIDTTTGVATLVSTLNTPFTGGTVSGFDFNPVADRLRLVGANDQDFRINVDTGEVTVDGTLAFAPGDPNAASNPTVTAAAYENAVADPTVTELYNIDSALDILTEQDPPNDGTQVTVGVLGADFGDVGGFDIVSPAQGVNMGFALSGATLYSVDLDNGPLTSLGTVGDGSDLNVIGLTAIDDPRTPPTAAGPQFIALAGGNTLQSFDGGSPDVITETVVMGLDGNLLGIDVRPANGLVYGLTDNNSLYIINPATGNSTFISTLSQPFPAANVTGFDFNPAADRLRLVGDNDVNFRINVDTGAVTVDGDLAFGADDANQGTDPTVTAVGYINAIADPSTTLLYDIDSDLDVLAVQAPANDGTLFTVGDLGVDFGDVGGLDIVTAGQGNNSAFAVTNGTFYTIDLETGAATAQGTVGDGTDPITGLTALPNAPLIDLNTQFTALASNNTLITFSASDPDSTTATAVTGVNGTLIGIDTRPANGLVYGLSTTNDVYTIDTATGVATLVSTLDTPFNGGTVSGFDFNPVADRLRLVGANDQDFRINVDTGEVTVDGDLAFGIGDVNQGTDPTVTAAAYENAIANPSTTELYNIDSALDILTEQDPPNDGTQITVGELGVDFGDLGGFDIVTAEEGNNTGFAVSGSTLYSINLETGVANNLGMLGDVDGLDIIGLTATGPGNTGSGMTTLGDDIIIGTDGDDTLRGNNGNDTLSGRGGNDTLFGGRGDDTLNGGAGDDVLRGLAGNDNLRGGIGSDRLRGNGGDDVIQGNAGEDDILGGSGNDTLRGGGDSDVLRGAKGADILFGGSGSDTLFGGRGNDQLFGNAGRDVLRADGGDDLLDGGIGNDEIRTGSGNDTVVLRASGGTDTIFRFDVEGNDVIQLDGISFGQLSLEVEGNNTFIILGDQTLAVVVRNTSLTQGDFTSAA